MANEPNETSDFRRRLAAIPKMDDVPADELWNEAKPRASRGTAPVARPHVTRHHAREHVPEQQRVRIEPSVDSPEQWSDDPRRRRRWPLVLLVLAALVFLAVLLPVLSIGRTFNSIERVDVADVLAEPLPGATNLLLIGTDSRDGIDAETDNAEVILGEGLAGSRTDTIMVLRMEEEGSKFLSLPRDLWLPIDGGDPQRINTAFAQGPDALINTVQVELGIPISHYVQVDLAGFIDLVDAVGGVEITIPHPAFDRGSGLDLPNAGPVVLDSAQALAYVRSRFYTEIRDGVEVVDPTSDLGRVQRQQEFLRSLLLTVSEERNPATINSMTAAIADALIVDDGTSLSDAVVLANTLRTSTPESVTLPTAPMTTAGGAQVLTLTPESPAALAQFG